MTRHSQELGIVTQIVKMDPYSDPAFVLSLTTEPGNSGLTLGDFLDDSIKTSFTSGKYIYGRLETGDGTLREVLKFSPITSAKFSGKKKTMLEPYNYRVHFSIRHIRH